MLDGNSAGLWRRQLRLWLQSTVINVALLLGVFQLLGEFRPPGNAPRAAMAQPFERTALANTEGGTPFWDARPDAVLVGLRVTIDQFLGRWDVIFSAQPIYRLPDGEIVRGTIHGADRGLELVSEARPGYAVGRLEVAHGGRIDGLRCVSCANGTASWIPPINTRGAGSAQRRNEKPDELASDGKPAIGIYGRGRILN